MITQAKFDAGVFRDIVQFIRIGVLAILDAGQVESWNPAAERMLGWRETEVRGKPLPLELPQAAEHGEAEGEICRRDGQMRILRVQRLPWRDPGGTRLGRLLLLTDITARREAEDRDREHLRFGQLLDAAPDATIEVDREGRIVLLNKVTEQLFGYRREGLLNQPVELLIPNELRAGHHRYRESYWANPSRRPMGTGLNLHGQQKDGSRFPVEISLSPVQFEDGPCVSAIIRDVVNGRKQSRS